MKCQQTLLKFIIFFWVVAMQTSVHWLENVAFEAKSESGHSVVMDGSPEYGGENRGPRPMELILIVLAQT